MVHNVTKRKPKVKIIGINDDLSKEELKKKIMNQNNTIEREKVEIKKNESKVAVELDGTTYKKVIGEGKLKIGWEIRPVLEHKNVLRCFKCFIFNLIADD